jgi:hypothetical protein
VTEDGAAIGQVEKTQDTIDGILEMKKTWYCFC